MDRTHAEMNPIQTHNKTQWHAFGHSDKRFRELWLRSVAEPDLELRLIKLGQFMHFLEDWEAHAGYGLRMGHARDTYRGRDPDSLGNSLAKNHRMIQAALDHLLATCKDLGRESADQDQRLIEIMKKLYAENLMDDLFDASDPDWKRGKLGGFRTEGPEIKSVNKARIEQLIERYYKPLPHKNIPQDFVPGTETGIPESLAIPFDRDGRVVSNRSVRVAMKAWATASEAAPDVVLSLEDALINYRNSGRLRRSGWTVLVRVYNEGEMESMDGQIEIVVIDSDDETVLAQTSENLPSLQAGETREFSITIASSGRPEPDVIIGAFARVGDLTAQNDEDWLMLGDAEEEEPVVPIITDLDPPPAGPETIRFLDTPRFFIIDNTACVLVTAYTSGGDSTEKLDVVVLEVIGGMHAHYFQRVVPGRWSAVSTSDGLVAGKTYECFTPTAENHEFLSAEKPESLRIAVTLEAAGTDPYTEEFPLPQEFLKNILELAKRSP